MFESYADDVMEEKVSSEYDKKDESNVENIKDENQNLGSGRDRIRNMLKNEHKVHSEMKSKPQSQPQMNHGRGDSNRTGSHSHSHDTGHRCSHHRDIKSDHNHAFNTPLTNQEEEDLFKFSEKTVI